MVVVRLLLRMQQDMRCRFCDSQRRRSLAGESKWPAQRARQEKHDKIPPDHGHNCSQQVLVSQYGVARIRLVCPPKELRAENGPPYS